MIKYYSKIVDLPLSKFIEIKVSDPRTLAPLIISGEPAKTDLEFAWMEIEQEYADAMGTEAHKLYIKLLKETTLIKVSYDTVQRVIPSLLAIPLESFLVDEEGNKEIFDEVSRIAKELDSIIKSGLKFDPLDPEKFRHNLNRAKNQSKSLKIKLDLKESEFEAIKKKHEDEEGGEKKKETVEYYHSILFKLSDFAKFNISDSISVFEFCTRIKRYNEYQAQIEQLHSKK